MFIRHGFCAACVARSNAAGPPEKSAGPFESCPQLRKLVSEKNGPEVHSKFLHHRAHRPRQIHARRPFARNDWRAAPARNARTSPRLPGTHEGARAKTESE